MPKGGRWGRVVDAELRRARAAAAGIQKQAARLWGHLPPEDVPGLDEPLHFGLSPAGGLRILVDRSGTVFELRGDHALRVRPLTDHRWEVARFRGGKLWTFQVLEGDEWTAHDAS